MRFAAWLLAYHFHKTIVTPTCAQKPVPVLCKVGGHCPVPVSCKP